MFKPYHTAELQFDLVREIGQDGQNSQTYVATDHQLNAQIVIKRIEKAKLSSPADFFDESKALYASAHPNVVQIHYACYDDEHVFVAMPLYARGSLKGLMSTRHLTVREIVVLSCQILSGLHNIHSKRLIHFDVKPDNILLSDRGEALLADFGLAKQMNFSGHAGQDRFYHKMIAPEVASGTAHFDRRIDIYQFGLTLYRMCCGNTAFYEHYNAYNRAVGFDRAGFRRDIRNEDFPDRSAFPAHIPGNLRNIVRKCIKADLNDRYGSAIDVANALAAVSGNHLDWRYVPTGDKRVWNKNEQGTNYEFSVEATGKAECFKTRDGGQRRRFGEGCRATMTEQEVKRFLGAY